MRVIKDHINDEDKGIALRVMNKLRMGERVFGKPSEGLKITMKKLEQQMAEAESNRDALQFLDNDGELKEQYAKLKAGITGEETLAEWFERIIKYDPELEDIVVFASLSDPEQNNGDDYISDSDFIAVYGNNVLILDAKNIRTNPDLPIYLDESMLVTVGGAEIMDLHPSVYVWKNVFSKYRIPYTSVHGCTVIVNKTGACVWKNAEWYKSDVKPIHISELVDFLHEWIKDAEPETNLSLLTVLAKMQIKSESDSTLNMDSVRKRFGI